MKKTITRTLTALALATVVAVSHSASATENAQASTPSRVATYYFGNSLTGCTNPQWHPLLGKSAGKEWETFANLGAGWQLWQHFYEIEKGGFAFDPGAKGDLTLDAEFIAQQSVKLKRFYDTPWDSVVLQFFSQSMEYITDKMWGNTFDQPRDIGDFANAVGLIDTFLTLNPRGRVFIYQNWPDMKPGKVPPESEWPEWAKALKQRTGKKPRTAEFPDREAFDYEAEWLGKKYTPDHPDKQWLDNTRCQDFGYQLFEKLKAHYPQLWEQNRLTMIPVGDIYLALHRKAKVGEFDGIADIEEYYTDVQHTRCGLPRYTGAAAFFACIFKEHPGVLDHTIYNDKAQYGDDPSHDDGELLEITPERARIVNDTIWEVVTTHPYTRMNRE